MRKSQYCGAFGDFGLSLFLGMGPLKSKSKWIAADEQFCVTTWQKLTSQTVQGGCIVSMGRLHCKFSAASFLETPAHWDGFTVRLGRLHSLRRLRTEAAAL